MSIIRYANDICIVLDIQGHIYYVYEKTLPKVYDENLNLLEIRNINYWLEQKTGFCFKQIDLMAEAFIDGLKGSYCLSDIKLISSLMIKATEDAIFKTDLTSDYSTTYWIELMDITSLQKFIITIRDNYDRLLKEYGASELLNVLCRAWQLCNIRYQDKMHVFEMIIRKKLKKEPHLPKYPNTSDLNNTIQQLVFGIVFNTQYQEYKNIPNEILLNIIKLGEKYE